MDRATLLPRLLAGALLSTAALCVAVAQTSAPRTSTPQSATPPASTSANRAKTGAKPAPPQTKAPQKLRQKPGEVAILDWRDLLPAEERSRYSPAAPPPEHGPLGEGGPPAVQKQTTTVNADLANLNVRLPGFIVPVGAPRDGLVKEFFLVPYIGECIHVPPPPPNQMVYVTSTSGIAANALHEAYWVTGKMRIETRTTPLGTSAYAMSAGQVELYQY